MKSAGHRFWREVLMEEQNQSPNKIISINSELKDSDEKVIQNITVGINYDVNIFLFFR